METSKKTPTGTVTDEAAQAAAAVILKAATGTDDHHPTAVAGYMPLAHEVLEAAVPYLAPKVDREALAKAAHHHFCIRRDQPNHDPRQSDYDKADEILEILALIKD